MRLYHFTLIFSVLALSAAIVCENRLELSSADFDNTGKTDTAFDRACDAAALALRGMGEELSRQVIVNAETQFINSLCAYFGINAFSPEGRQLMLKIPVIAVTVHDGMYVGFLSDENGTVVRRWTSKTAYEDKSPEEILEEYCMRRTAGADPQTTSYRFELPADDEGMFQRNLHETGFAAFYRSPVKERSSYVQYTYASSVSKTATHFYINISGTGLGSPVYYHLKDCSYRNEECMEFNSREECARFGAFICPVCRDIL